MFCRQDHTLLLARGRRATRCDTQCSNRTRDAGDDECRFDLLCVHGSPRVEKGMDHDEPFDLADVFTVDFIVERVIELVVDFELSFAARWSVAQCSKSV